MLALCSFNTILWPFTRWKKIYSIHLYFSRYFYQKQIQQNVKIWFVVNANTNHIQLQDTFMNSNTLKVKITIFKHFLWQAHFFNHASIHIASNEDFVISKNSTSAHWLWHTYTSHTNTRPWVVHQGCIDHVFMEGCGNITYHWFRCIYELHH